MRQALLLIIILMSFISPNALASTCVSLPHSDQYKNATVIFIGTVLEISGEERCGSKEAVFKVSKVYKGKSSDEIKIYSGDSCMGLGAKFVQDRKYLVFAEKIKNSYDPKTWENINTLGTGVCAGTRQLDWVQEDTLLALEQKKKQIKLFDDLAKGSPEDLALILRLQAEHFLYWSDYQNAEGVLYKFLELEPENLWAQTELFRSLHEQEKAEAIWNFHHENGKKIILHHQDDYNKYLFSAMFALGKQLEDKQYLFLKDSIFNGLNKRNSDIHFNYMQDVSFNGVNFSNSKFLGRWIRRAKIHGGDFSRARLNSLSLEDIQFRKTNLQNADFSDSTISELSFSGSDLLNANFSRAEIKNSFFANTDLQNADFTNAKILGSQLYRTDFSNAVLNGVFLGGSEYTCETKWPEGFDPKAAGAYPHKPCKEDKEVE